MAVLGFTLPHFLNRMLLHTVEKDKAKTHQRPAFRSFPVFNSVEEWTNRLSVYNNKTITEKPEVKNKPDLL